MMLKRSRSGLPSNELSYGNQAFRLTSCALFTALITVSTMIIKIPIPVTGGYIHPGDGFILLSALVLGPLYGGFAAGIGSAFADVLSGYAFYAPATLLIKGFTAVIASVVFSGIKRLAPDNEHLCLFAAGILAECWMVIGYFLFEAALLSPPAAATGVPFNLIQGIFGVVIAYLLLTIHRSYKAG